MDKRGLASSALFTPSKLGFYTEISVLFSYLKLLGLGVGNKGVD